VLLRFEVSNHRSILDPVELSMIAVDQDRAEVRYHANVDQSVVTVAGIYGPNASGKSNVIAAIRWLSDAVATSMRGWEDSVPRQSCKFGGGPQETSYFEIEMMIEGIRHEYQLEVDDERIIYEALYEYPVRRRRMLFERDHSSIKFQRGIGDVTKTRELITARTLILSAARKYEHPAISRFASKLVSIRFMGEPFGQSFYSRHDTMPRRILGRNFTNRWFQDGTGESVNENEQSSRRKRALALLQLADLGIDDVQFEEEQPIAVRANGEEVALAPRQRVKLLHKTENGALPFDMSEESAGTRTWYRLIGPTLSALESGAILLFDELDASLHPVLSAKLIELFQNNATNPAGAQLIFTSHDTNLLNHLNRDEVWFTGKTAFGTTKLTALAEFGGDKVRRSQNLERSYLQGRFGFLPEPSRALVIEAIESTINTADMLGRREE
jgi:predicted ATPase